MNDELARGDAATTGNQLPVTGYQQPPNRCKSEEEMICKA